MDAGGPDGDLRELLKLYRDRDARDAKIRSLEQALADAQRVTPGGSQEETGKLAVQVQQLQENVTAYSRKCDELRGVKDAHEATIKSLRSTLDDNFRALGELQQSNAASEIVIQKAEQRNSTLAATVEKLRDQIATHETTVSELRAVIASMTAELAGSGSRPDQASLPTPLMSDNGSSSLDGDDGEGQSAMQAHIVDLSMQLQEAKSEVDSLHGQLTSHIDENVALQSRIKELEDADHSERVRELEVECEDKTRELATSEARATALTAELDAVSEQILRLKSAYNEKHQEATSLSATVLDLKTRVEYAENQYGESVVRVAELSQQKELLETEVKGKDIELERIRTALAAADNDRATLRANVAEKTSRAAELEATVTDLRERLTLTRKEKASLNVALEAKDSELATLTAKFGEKNAELDASLSLKAALEAEMAEVREKLSEVASLQEQLVDSDRLAAKLGAELTAAAQHANNVQTDLDTTRKKLATLQPLEKEVLELRTSATSTRAELETATAKLAKLQASWKELEGVRAQLVEAEQRASDLDTQLVAARSEALTTPTTRRLQHSPTPSLTETATAGDDLRVFVRELKQKIRILETENTLLIKNSPQRAQVPVTGPVAPVGDVTMLHSVQDVVCSLQDKKEACRVWVTNMYEAASRTELVQSEVFLQYHTDLAQFNRPRLPAVEFFKVCEAVYPGVAIEHRLGPSSKEPVYVVTGMARRQVRAGGGPTSSQSQSQPLTPQASLVTAAGPVKDEVKAEEKKPLPTYVEKDVQAEAPVPATLPTLLPEPPIPEYTNRLKPWSANESVDFKMWLRHKVLDLTDIDCLRPIARSPVDALKRYNFTMRSIEKVQGLKWETDKVGVYRVPKDFDAYRNAEFTMDTVRESIGVQKKVWEADYSTFGQGVENAPLVKAWINEPDDPQLLGMFGNLTREQFSACKANGDANPPPVTPTTNLKQGKKRARESGGPGSEGALKKHRSSSDVNPPASAGKS